MCSSSSVINSGFFSSMESSTPVVDVEKRHLHGFISHDFFSVSLVFLFFVQYNFTIKTEKNQ